MYKHLTLYSQICCCGGTEGALAAMKRKKALEIQVQHLQNNIDRVNEQMTTLEGTGMTATVLDSLAYASKASKETMQSLNVNEVDRVLESINDQNQQMQEIQEAMGQPLGAAADIDDEELLNELEVWVYGLRCMPALSSVLLIERWQVGV